MLATSDVAGVTYSVTYGRRDGVRSRRDVDEKLTPGARFPTRRVLPQRPRAVVRRIRSYLAYAHHAASPDSQRNRQIDMERRGETGEHLVCNSNWIVKALRSS